MIPKHKYALVASLAWICYMNTLFGGFVFDDTEAVVKNKDVMPESTSLYEVFSNDFWGMNIQLNSSHKSYRPLTILSYQLNVVLAKNTINAMHFHVTNVLCYVILCILILKVLSQYLRKDLAFLSVVLFTVHPVHTEVVASIVGRADLLSSISFFISALLYKKALRKSSQGLWKSSMFLQFLNVLIIFLGVLCKETAISALGFCFVIDLLKSKVLKLRLTKKVLRQNVAFKSFARRSLFLFTSTLLIILFRLRVMNFEGPMFTKIDNPAAFSDDYFSKIFTYNYVYFLNLLLLLWPQWLCFDWSMGCVPLISSTCDIRIGFVHFFWAFLSFSVLVMFKKYSNANLSSSLVFGMSLMVLPFIPASNLFIKVGFVIAERTLLLPSCGFCILIASGVIKLQRKNKAFLRIFYLLCLIMALKTIQRNFEWLTEETLFTSALSVCPLNAKVHYNVAKVAADKHNKYFAIEKYQRAIELNPDYEQAMNNLANIFREDKKFVEAENLLRRAVLVRPNFAAAWMNLGIVLATLNQTLEAEDCYKKAIAFRPKYPDCYYNLGNLYLDLKRNEDALIAWKMAVSYKPTHTAAWSNALVLLDSLNKFDDVKELGKIALMHNPKAPALHFSIANTLGKLQKFEKAEKHFLEALNFSPRNALYYSNLGVLYHRWGKKVKAREMYKKALHLDPSLKTTENNLKKLLTPQKSAST